MRRTNSLLIIILSILFSCIDPYSPKYDINATKKYVVSGQITDQEGYQYIQISLTTSLAKPQYIPLTDCKVEVMDNNGNSFLFDEYAEGKYSSWIDQEHLIPGNSFKVKIITPAGIRIESEYDQMPVCPQVDSVYYQRLDLPTNNPDVMQKGVRFYLDLDATATDSRYFKYEIIESYEYHSSFLFEGYYDGRTHKINPPDDSRSVCYKTELMKDIYTLTTKNLLQNQYKRFPLHFVDNTTQRLLYQYCLEIRQYAISEKAFAFWSQLQQNATEMGGLFDKQPFNITSNLFIPDQPEAKVLGYFNTASVKTRRFFFKDIPNLDFEFYNACIPQDFFLALAYNAFTPSDYPVYLVYNTGYSIGYVDPGCVDCQLLGGSVTKPEFWP